MVHYVRVPVFLSPYIILTYISFVLSLYIDRLERECQIQVLASTALSHRGPGLAPIKVNPEEAAYTYNRLGNEDAGRIFAGVSLPRLRASAKIGYGCFY